MRLTTEHKAMIERAGLRIEDFEPNENRKTDGILNRISGTEDVADMAYVNSELALALLENE